MDQITRNKVLIGSLYKSINKARLLGTLDLKILYLLELIQSYVLACEHPSTFKEKKVLNHISLIIQNKYPEICNYRFNDVIKFATIVGCENCKPGLNNNPLQVINNAPTVSDPEPIVSIDECPSLCVNYEYYYNQLLKFTILLNTDFFKFLLDCYHSNISSAYAHLKIISLPQFGILSYNDAPIEENTIINFSENGVLKYTPIQTNLDYFQFQIGDSEDPTNFSNVSNFNINPI